MEFLHFYDFLQIVMEFCDLGSIQDILLKKGSGLDEQFIVNITEQVLQGLSYLHSKSFLHRGTGALVQLLIGI